MQYEVSTEAQRPRVKAQFSARQRREAQESRDGKARRYSLVAFIGNGFVKGWGIFLRPFFLAFSREARKFFRPATRGRGLYAML